MQPSASRSRRGIAARPPRTRRETKPNSLSHASSMGFCVGNSPNRFLIVTRCRENLSSGEKRAAGERPGMLKRGDVGRRLGRRRRRGRGLHWGARRRGGTARLGATHQGVRCASACRRAPPFAACTRAFRRRRCSTSGAFRRGVRRRGHTRAGENRGAALFARRNWLRR